MSRPPSVAVLNLAYGTAGPRFGGPKLPGTSAKGKDGGLRPSARCAGGILKIRPSNKEGTDGWDFRRWPKRTDLGSEDKGLTRDRTTASCRPIAVPLADAANDGQRGRQFWAACSLLAPRPWLEPTVPAGHSVHPSSDQCGLSNTNANA